MYGNVRRVPQIEQWVSSKLFKGLPPHSKQYQFLSGIAALACDGQLFSESKNGRQESITKEESGTVNCKLDCPGNAILQLLSFTMTR